MENRGFWALEAPPQRENQMKLQRSYLQTNISVLPGQRCARSHMVRSIVVPHAFDCLLCVRFQGRVISIYVQSLVLRSTALRLIIQYGSIADNCLIIPTAQELKRWSVGPAKTTLETWVHVSALNRDPCARVQYARSHQVCSIILSGVKTSTFLNFSPFESQFALRTYNTLKH